jgi:putative membrane protein
MNYIRTFGKRAALTAAFAVSLGSALAQAQDGAPPPPVPNSAPNTQSDSLPPNQSPETPANQPMRHRPPVNAQPKSDADFAKAAAQGGEAEVKLGQLAMQNGSSDSVKNFGKKMVDDHLKAGENLKAAATQSNVDLPTGLAPKDQMTYDRLAKLNGPAFDQAYARDMVRDHIQDIAEFRQESTSGTDTNIKQFATATLPTLQEHLRAARAMATEVGVQPHHPKGAPDGAGTPPSGSGENPTPPQQR